jgi:cell wall-associated NlpC family hydrolase
MFVRKLFPCALAACSILGISLSAQAQTVESRPRQIVQVVEPEEFSCSPDVPMITAEAAAEDVRIAKPPVASGNLTGATLEQMLSAAIDVRLGSRYRWGGTGPNGFDCSGFVWSIFQSAGIDFERGSARALWGRFEAPAPEEKFKFGTLVFFRRLAHVGMVVDEHGFYHASRHHGVVYSPFNDYWVSRIDGFRKVPMNVIRVTD